MLEQCMGELVGTLFLILLGDGVVANVLLRESKGYQSGWITITTGWFIAVVLGIFTAQFFGSPNADINPAVSLGKYWMNLYTFHQFLLFATAQTTGAFLGAILVWLSYLPHFRYTENKHNQLMVFCTKPAILDLPANFICEVIATAVLIIGIVAIFGRTELEIPVKGLGPYLVGVLVWGIGLSLGGPTGYAINPARDFGPRLAHALLPIRHKGSSEWGYAWVPIFGPFVGASLAACVIIVMHLST